MNANQQLDLPKGLNPFAAGGSNTSAPAHVALPAPMVFLMGAMRANLDAVRHADKVYLPHPSARVVEDCLKNGDIGQVLGMAPHIRELQSAERNYLAACACYYLDDPAFTAYLSTGAAASTVYTVQKANDPESQAEYFFNDWSPVELHSALRE